jgi:type IV fimbrial biogenesis protein FimT
MLVFIDKNKNRQVDTGEQILQIDVLNLKYGNLSWRGALSLPSVTYQAHTALPIGSNGSFYYCSTHLSNQQRIVLSKMGHIRIESLSSC